MPTLCWWTYTELFSSTDDLHSAEGQGQSSNCCSNFRNQNKLVQETAVNRAVGGAERRHPKRLPGFCGMPLPSLWDMKDCGTEGKEQNGVLFVISDSRWGPSLQALSQGYGSPNPALVSSSALEVSSGLLFPNTGRLKVSYRNSWNVKRDGAPGVP